MAVRFACPSCRQPIEIDDEWAGQSVGCPYCSKVVAAPASSTWPPEQVPVASPLAPVPQPPVPPGGQAGSEASQGQMAPSVAPWALTLAMTSAILGVFAVLVWLVILSQALSQTKVMQKLGPNPKPEAMQKAMPEAMQEILASGHMPRSSLSTAAAIVGGLCGIGGLTLAIRSLLWQQPRRGMAILACVISVAFTCCQGFLLLLAVGGQAAAK